MRVAGLLGFFALIGWAFGLLITKYVERPTDSVERR